MPTSTEDEMSESASTPKGRTKRIGGDMTDDENLKGQGNLDKVKGAGQTLKGKTKDALNRGTNKI